MPEYNLPGSVSCQYGGMNICLVFQCKCLASCNPGIFRPADHCQCNNSILNSPTKYRSNSHGKYQSRECQTYIRNSHYNRVNSPSKISAPCACCSSKYGNNGHQDKCRKNTCSGTTDHPGKHIPSISICSHRMLYAGWL